MARYAGDLKVATRIFEAAAWQYAVKVKCRCGRAGVFDPHGLWWRFEQKGWSDDFGRALRRFYCALCSRRQRAVVRPVKIEACREVATIHLTLPDERIWKRALSRMRG